MDTELRQLKINDAESSSAVWCSHTITVKAPSHMYFDYGLCETVCVKDSKPSSDRDEDTAVKAKLSDTIIQHGWSMWATPTLVDPANRVSSVKESEMIWLIYWHLCVLHILFGHVNLMQKPFYISTYLIIWWFIPLDVKSVQTKYFSYPYIFPILPSILAPSAVPQ